jgi:putative FmdB family regulatory protein
MPLFEYRCPDGHLTEQIRKSDVTEIVCPLCGARAERRISRPGAVGALTPGSEPPCCAAPGGCCGGACEV